MSLRVNTNVEAFNAHRNLSATSTALSKSMEKLSSGLRINRAADDAAGLAISEGMRCPDPRHRPGQPQRPGRHLARPDGGGCAERDALDPAAHPRAADPVRQRHAVHVRPGQDHGRGRPAHRRARPHPRHARRSTASRCSAPRAPARPSRSRSAPTRTSTRRTTRTASASPSRRSRSRPSRWTCRRSTPPSAPSRRSARTSAPSRTGSSTAVANLGVTEENLSASESRIRDVDVAQEMVNFTRLQILSQSGTAMLAQANQAPQSVLSLLR